MKVFRLTACLLAALLLLSSCGIVIINRGEEPGPATESETDFPPLTDSYESKDYPVVTEPDWVAEAEKWLGDLRSANFNGTTVFFLVAEGTGFTFDEEDDLYRAAVLKRNELVNKKYNVQIITERKNASTLLSEVKKADRAGDFYSDFVVIRSGDMSAYLEGGYLLNLKSLPYADYGAPYFDHKGMDQLTVGDAVYGAVGAATAQIESYACLYFNKSYAEELGVSCPYKEVYDGTFTWDRFLDSLEDLPKGTTRFVSAFEENKTAAMSYFSSGERFLTCYNLNQPRLSCDTKTAKTMISHVKKLFSLDTAKLTLEEQDGESEKTLKGFDIFKEGKALYALGSVADMESLQNAGFSWEVLPLPKLSEKKAFYTPMTADAPVIAALATSQRLELMGHVLQAINAASCDNMAYEFYKDAMQRLITGTNTLDMLDFIRETPVYDLAFMLGEDVKAVRAGTYDALRDAAKGKQPFSYYLDSKKTALNNYFSGLS